MDTNEMNIPGNQKENKTNGDDKLNSNDISSSLNATTQKKEVKEDGGASRTTDKGSSGNEEKDAI